MANGFWLSEAQWAAIEPHLPKNQPGARRVDDRRVLSGIFHNALQSLEPMVATCHLASTVRGPARGL